MKYKEIIKLLETADWYFVRQKGSHKIYRNKKTNKIVVIAGNGNKDIPIGIFEVFTLIEIFRVYPLPAALMVH